MDRTLLVGAPGRGSAVQIRGDAGWIAACSVAPADGNEADMVAVTKLEVADLVDWCEPGTAGAVLPPPVRKHVGVDPADLLYLRRDNAATAPGSNGC